MRKNIKVTVLILFPLICSIILSAFWGVKTCQDNSRYFNDRVLVVVSAECKEQFENQTFTKEDFLYDGIKHIEYRLWQDETPLYQTPELRIPEHGLIIVHLKRSGVKSVERAMDNIGDLPFVLNVSLHIKEMYEMY